MLFYIKTTKYYKGKGCSYLLQKSKDFYFTARLTLGVYNNDIN